MTPSTVVTTAKPGSAEFDRGSRADQGVEAVATRPCAFKNARRDQASVSSGFERNLLIRLAQRTPACINSDHLTALGSVSMFLTGASYALARWSSLGLVSATVFLALSWLGDSLDGTLARVRKSERPRYGFYLDHMLDTFGAFFVMSGLALSGYLDWRIAAGMLVVFLMLSIEVYLATYTLNVFKLSFGKLGPTEIRILLAAANVALWVRPQARFFHSNYRLLDGAGCIAIIGMAVMLLTSAVRHAHRLYREERLPRAGSL